MQILARILVRVFLALTLAAGLSAPMALPLAAATENAGPDYRAWETVAKRAESAVADARASDAAFKELRDEIVNWRTQFTVAQDANKERIQTLRGQIAALGAPPEEGQTEAREIAQRRTALTKQLAQLEAPGLAAVEAFSRADGIIREIDRILRERQADQLLRLSPTPANPANWPGALKRVNAAGQQIMDEILRNAARDTARSELKTNAPAIVGFLALALVLMARGRRWIERLSSRLSRLFALRGQRAVGTLVSLGQIALPLAGLTLLVSALRETGLFGTQGEALLGHLPLAGLFLFAAVWLGGRVFPRAEMDEPPLGLWPDRRAEGRFLVSMMGLVLALLALVQTAIVPLPGVSRGVANLWGEARQVVMDQATEAAAAVIELPLVVVGGLLLFRFGLLLRRRPRGPEGEEQPFRDRLAGLVGTGTLIVAILGPLLAVIGYVAAANALIWPTMLSLGVIGLVFVVLNFVNNLYAFVMRLEGDEDSLAPVLIGFALSLAAVPVLALIWGARPDDLAEVWTRFQNGFDLGGVRLSPTALLTFGVVFTLGYGLTRLMQGALKSSVLPRTKLDTGGRNAVVSGVGYVGIFAAALLAITSAGIDLSSLAIVAGALSVGIGFGLQNIVSNFVSGIILLIERPISQGDWIEVGGQMGIVKDISVRSTRIETFDRTDVIVPNADLVAGQVTNWTRGNVTGRLIVKVGVAYGTDTRKVERILTEIAEAHPLVMVDPEPRVYFMGFGADSLDFDIRVMLSDVNFKLSVNSEMHHQIAERFKAEGIEIPYAQRDVWLRNPEALVSAPQAVAPASPAPSGKPALPDRASIAFNNDPDADGDGDGDGR